MNVEDIREFALSKSDVEETFPFGDNIIVFKTNKKAFLFLPLSAETLRFNVKCDPDLAIELREQYDCIHPGYHMNKKHWNTIFVDGTLSAELLKKFINDSYKLVSKT
ncbi:MAG: MmcQ/YjbR family DNA-binding protein [Chitinophagaceae bacterium]|nr:MmcQ/YjbR family DNA-binding protein [Chitinophagaceae bacterium]